MNWMAWSIAALGGFGMLMCILGFLVAIGEMWSNARWARLTKTRKE